MDAASAKALSSSVANTSQKDDIPTVSTGRNTFVSMAPSLSSNTLGLKFMQRGAAAKAAAQSVKKEQDASQPQRGHHQKKQKPTVSHQQNQVKHEGSSRERDSDDSNEEETASHAKVGETSASPVASTSRLSARPRSAITMEASYLAFPILSSAYGVSASASATEQDGGGTNGRLTFGQVSKTANGKGKGKQTDTDSEGDTGSSQESSSTSKPNQRINGKPKPNGNARTIATTQKSSRDSQQSIRERQKEENMARKRIKTEQRQNRGTTSSEDVEEELVRPSVKYEEDTSFVDDMILQARQKRQSETSSYQDRKRRK